MADALTTLLLEGFAGATPWKASARVAATTSITKSGTQTIDGVLLAEGDRVLLTGQSSAHENGLWLVAAGAWRRAEDMDDNAEARIGSVVLVTEGTEGARSIWRLTSPTNGTITLGVTSQTWTRGPSLGPNVEVFEVSRSTGSAVPLLLWSRTLSTPGTYVVLVAVGSFRTDGTPLSNGYVPIALVRSAGVGTPTLVGQADPLNIEETGALSAAIVTAASAVVALQVVGDANPQNWRALTLILRISA